MCPAQHSGHVFTASSIRSLCVHCRAILSQLSQICCVQLRLPGGEHKRAGSSLCQLLSILQPQALQTGELALSSQRPAYMHQAVLASQHLCAVQACTVQCHSTTALRLVNMQPALTLVPPDTMQVCSGCMAAAERCTAG